MPEAPTDVTPFPLDEEGPDADDSNLLKYPPDQPPTESKKLDMLREIINGDPWKHAPTPEDEAD